MSKALHVAAAALLSLPALASAQVLDFEGILTGGAQTAPVGNFYDGGGGTNYGIAFSPNALAICLNTATQLCSNGSRGGQGNPASQFSGLFFLSGAETFMTRAAGFTTGFSFFYTAAFSGGSFSVYDGVDGTGNVLASLSLPTTPNGAATPGCFGSSYCPFVAAGVTFAGTAQSVGFAGVANQIAFDDVTFGSATPGNVVPEPGTWLLLASGLGVLTAVARRSRRT